MYCEVYNEMRKLRGSTWSFTFIKSLRFVLAMSSSNFSNSDVESMSDTEILQEKHDTSSSDVSIVARLTPEGADPGQREYSFSNTPAPYQQSEGWDTTEAHHFQDEGSEIYMPNDDEISVDYSPGFASREHLVPGSDPDGDVYCHGSPGFFDDLPLIDADGEVWGFTSYDAGEVP